jgi:hypothetical protein
MGRKGSSQIAGCGGGAVGRKLRFLLSFRESSEEGRQGSSGFQCKKKEGKIK